MSCIVFDICLIHTVHATSEMEMGHSQWHRAHWAAMWLSKTFSSCQSLFHTISITVCLLPTPAAAHMAHWSGINMVPLSLDPKCLSGRMRFLTELSHKPSLSQQPVCVHVFVIEYLSYAAVWTQPSQQYSIHIPDWEKKEWGKKERIHSHGVCECLWQITSCIRIRKRGRNWHKKMRHQAL